MQRYRSELILSALLLVLVQVALHGVLANGFVNYDDPLYIMSNPHVSTGLTASNFAWAFRNTDCATWHPLTWLSLQLDRTLFGPSAVGFHVTNLLFHGGSTVALFLLLRRLIGSRLRSVFVAALFAVHPLHVESVAWATERKDVLSTLLALLTMHAHVGYVERPGNTRWTRSRSTSVRRECDMAN